MEAKIYQPAKTAMQSGRGNSRKWIFEYEPEEAKQPDPLMGWAGSGDMRSQLRISFESKEDAIAYAVSQGVKFQIKEPKLRRIRPKSYADNFKFDRIK